MCTNLIRNAKINYIQRKNNFLNDKLTKIYRAVLNNFLKNIKIPSAPPILILGETITSIVEEANVFN